MITFQANPKKPSRRMQARFVRANAAMEGQRLTFSEMKSVVKVMNGKATADELIEQSIVRNGLRKRTRALRKG